MSFTQLKDQAAQLPPKERSELIAFLVSLQTESDQDFQKSLAAKLDDQNPANWVELDELQKRFANKRPCPTGCSWMLKPLKRCMRNRRKRGHD